MTDSGSRILIFRIGSIGDFVIALPCFHLIRERFPNSEIVLLTNDPGNDRIMTADSILHGSGLVDRYMKYAGGTRELDKVWRIKKEVQSLAPQALVYLAPPRGLMSAYRDYVFFRGAGIREIYGLPITRAQSESVAPHRGSGVWESEAQRLGRLLAPLGAIDFESEQSWSLGLSNVEIRAGAQILDNAWATIPGVERRVIGLSVGTKQPINDWGDANWRAVLRSLGSLGYSLVLFGGSEDSARSDKLGQCWPGPVLNLCGKVTPRVSAALLKHMRIFLCHDSGPMHLAAAVRTRCVAVFSRGNPPGIWFPFEQKRHMILYPTSKCGTIRSIRPRQVIGAAVELLDRPGSFRVSQNDRSQNSPSDVWH